MTEHKTQEEIFAIVAEKIADQKEIEVEKISLDSKFEDLEVDSLDAMEILFELEEELDLDIPDMAARSMRTVDDVVDGLGKLIRGEEIELPEMPEESADSTDNGTPPSAATGG